MLVNLLLCFIVHFTTVHCGDDDDATDPTPKETVDFQSQISVLSGKIDGAQTKFDQLNSDIGKKIENIDLSNKQRLTNLETIVKGSDGKFAAIDESLNKLKGLNVEDVSNAKQRLDTFGNELKNVEKKVNTIDLSQYVPKKEFTNAQKEISSLKSSLNNVLKTNKEMESQLSQLSELSQLNDIREELDELKKLKKLSSLAESNEMLQKEISSLKESLKKTTKELSDIKKNVRSDAKKSEDRIKQLGEGTQKASTDIERLKDDMDSVRQELVDLQTLVHLVKSQTIGTMIETGYETCKELAQRAFEITKEKSAILLELAIEYGNIFVSKIRELSISFADFVQKQFFIVKEKVQNYDYSWLTDEENWRLLRNYFKQMYVVASEWTRKEIIPAIQQQSTQQFQAIQKFVTNLYTNRRDNEIYKQVSEITMPILKQIDALPKEYHTLTMDIIMLTGLFFVILFGWLLLFIVCQCLCPKIPKVEDNSDGSGKGGRQRQRQRQQQQQVQPQQPVQAPKGGKKHSKRGKGGKK